MRENYAHVADDFLELASGQRLEILFQLQKQNLRIFQMAHNLDSTKQEVHRNFSRLAHSGLISKNLDGEYFLTTYGRTVCAQVPLLMFFTNNKRYFEDHCFGDLPDKFIMRIGQLNGIHYEKGIVRVNELCKSIYNNAEEYVYEILAELSLERISALAARTKGDVKLRYIASESAIVPRGRKQLLEKVGWKKLMDKGYIQRKMKERVQTTILLNEKEACIMFPKINEETDLTMAFCSDKESFHEWCSDYFRYCWDNAKEWQESKLKE